jgi:hypothetical protein
MDAEGGSAMTRYLVVIKPSARVPFVTWVEEADSPREAAEEYMDGSIDVGDTVLVAAAGDVAHFTREDRPELVEIREEDS